MTYIKVAKMWVAVASTPSNSYYPQASDKNLAPYSFEKLRMLPLIKNNILLKRQLGLSNLEVGLWCRVDPLPQGDTRKLLPWICISQENTLWLPSQENPRGDRVWNRLVTRLVQRLYSVIEPLSRWTKTPDQTIIYGTSKTTNNIPQRDTHQAIPCLFGRSFHLIIFNFCPPSFVVGWF